MSRLCLSSLHFVVFLAQPECERSLSPASPACPKAFVGNPGWALIIAPPHPALSGCFSPSLSPLFLFIPYFSSHVLRLIQFYISFLHSERCESVQGIRVRGVLVSTSIALCPAIAVRDRVTGPLIAYFHFAKEMGGLEKAKLYRWHSTKLRTQDC